MAGQHAFVTAGDVLTLDELRSLRRVSGVRGAALVLHAWGAIGLAMVGAALWPSVFTLMLAFGQFINATGSNRGPITLTVE